VHHFLHAAGTKAHDKAAISASFLGLRAVEPPSCRILRRFGRKLQGHFDRRLPPDSKAFRRQRAYVVALAWHEPFVGVFDADNAVQSPNRYVSLPRPPNSLRQR
jgi:hypothetical protein